MTTRARKTIVALVFLFLLGFRVAVIATWHAPGGDGVQYWKLAQQLKEGRFAFAPPPAPLSYARLPGYPLITALLCGPTLIGLGSHVERATLLNVLFDAGTAAVVFALIAWSGASRRAALVGAGLYLLSPLNLRVACYALTECVATLLLTAELWLAVSLADSATPRRRALVAGLVAGLAQLVRSDSLVALPFVAWALLRLADRWRLVAAWLLGFVLLFAPWMIRNQIQFGNPYPISIMLRTNEGEPLPDGFVRWARTWSASDPGDSYLDFLFTIKRPIDPNTQLRPHMFDSEAERRELLSVLALYNRSGMTEAVHQGFVKLAADRTARQPLRTYVTLPLRRLGKLFAPLPEYELPMRVWWLGLPAARPLLGALDYVLYGACLVGVVGLLRRRDGRDVPLLLALGSSLALRIAMFSFLVPVAAYQRYLVEGFPAMIVLAVVGIARLVPAPSRSAVVAEQASAPPAR